MGHMFRSNNSLNLHYRKDKFNYFSIYSYNINGHIQEMEIKRRFADATTDETLSYFDLLLDREGHRYA